MVAAFPDRSDGVDDVLNRRVEVERGGRHRVALVAGANGAPGLCQARSGGAVDSAIHTTAAKQRFVSSGNDDVYVLPRNVAQDDLDHCHSRILAHSAPTRRSMHASAANPPRRVQRDQTVRGRCVRSWCRKSRGAGASSGKVWIWVLGHETLARFVVDQRVVDQPFNSPPLCAHVSEGVPR